MTVRKLHRFVGMVFMPFFLITAATGAVLLFRGSSNRVAVNRRWILGVHNWELLDGAGVRYVGLVLAAGLLLMSVTGAIISIRMAARKRGRKAPGRTGRGGE